MGFHPTELEKSFQQALDRRHQIGRQFILRAPEYYEKRTDFVSNDFLSLNDGVHRDGTLKEIARNPKFNVGAGATRVAGGGSDYTFMLEKWLANFHHAESCLVFGSGYEANVAIFSVLPRPGDVIVHDSKIHASVHAGMRGSRASVIKPFDHNDPVALKIVLLEILQKDSDVAKGRKTVFVAIESIYSMDGDISPASQIVHIVKECLPLKNAVLVMDEAHSNGIMGPQGKGLVCDLGLENEFAVRLHTFGKGINATGAAVLCPPLFKETLVNYARNFIFTTGPAFLTLASVKASYDIISSAEGQQRRERLQARTRQFYRSLTQHYLWEVVCKVDRLRVPTAFSWKDKRFLAPIVPLLTSAGLSHSLEDRLADCGYTTFEVGFPIVPQDGERVRLIIHANHTKQQIDDVVDVVLNWAAGTRYCVLPSKN